MHSQYLKKLVTLLINQINVSKVLNEVRALINNTVSYFNRYYL